MLEQKSRSRARVKVAFFCVVGVHVAAIVVALLAQGCKREPSATTENQQPAVPEATNNLPVLEASNAVATVVSNVPPTPPPTPVETPVLAAQEYVIQKGDTFSTIAPKFHVSVKALQAANPGVNPATLQIGKKITIPAPTAAAPTVTPGATTVAPSGEELYVVKSGDSLTKIASEHHTTVNALRKLNNLTTDRIKVGDKLKLPAAAATPPAETTPAPAPSTPAPAPSTPPPSR